MLDLTGRAVRGCGAAGPGITASCDEPASSALMSAGRFHIEAAADAATLRRRGASGASDGMAAPARPARTPTAACTWLARLRKPAMAFCLACSASAVALKRSSADTSAPFSSS